MKPRAVKQKQMTATGTESSELAGVMRLTQVADHLAHVVDHSQSDEPSGTWTGLACPDHGVEVGADVDNATLQHLAQVDLADSIWEAPADFTTQHVSSPSPPSRLDVWDYAAIVHIRVLSHSISCYCQYHQVAVRV
jgi:hypothetical protein